MQAVDDAVIEGIDPVEFVRERLGFEPDEAQEAVLRSEAPRLLLNCTRQWGKSTITAAKAVHRAFTVAESTVLVTSPSERQSAELLRKAKGFVSMLDLKARGDGSNRIRSCYRTGADQRAAFGRLQAERVYNVRNRFARRYPMDLSRRTLLTGALVFSQSRAAAPDWDSPAKQFPLKKGLLYMNAANIAPAPASVWNAYVRQLSDFQANPAFPNREQ